MDTRLINQVVDWEWRIQMENEKKNINHSDNYLYFPSALEYCGKVVKSTLLHFINLGRNCILSIHLSESA